MMFDPATLGSALQPGDKMSVTFHKGQPKSTTPSFMDNVSAAQAQAPPPAPAPVAPEPMNPMAAADPHQAMAMALKAHLMAQMGHQG